MFGTSRLERRRFARRAPAGAEPLARARLRTGRDVAVVDVSDGGALLEGTARLLPGTHVDAHLITRDGRLLVRSRVLRAHVCHVDAEIVRYRAAVAFEQRVDTAPHGYPVPGLPACSGAPVGSTYPAGAEPQEGRNDETL